MRRSIICLSVAASVVVSGCANIKNEQAFGKSITDASSSLTSGVTFAQKVQFEDQLTEASKAFLITRPAVASISRSCSTDADKELALAKKRLIMFEVVNIYFKKIEAQLSSDIDFTKYTTDLDDASKAVQSLGIPVVSEVALISAVATPLAKAANGLEKDRDLIRVSQIAKKIAPNLKRVVDDIDAGLVSSQDNLNSAVKLWEQCEFERLQLIFSDASTSRAEMSMLFETYRGKLASFKSQNGVVIGTRNTLVAVLKKNKALYEPQLSFDDAKTAAADASSIINDFRAAITASQKL